MDSRVLKGGPRDQVLLIAVQVQRNRAEQHMAPLPLPLRAAAAARAPPKPLVIPPSFPPGGVISSSYFILGWQS